MENISFTLDEDGRIDVMVSIKCPSVSRSYAKRLIEEGNIKVNGKEIKANYKAKRGEEVEIFLPEPDPIEAKPQDISLDIVYEDDELVVINKPRNMVVHPAAGNESGTVVNAMLYHCKGNLSGINGAMRPGIVHRIDKDTTGLLVIAKNDEAHKFLSSQLQGHTLHRVYYALVNGNIKENEGEINAPIGRSPKDRKQMAVVKDGREALTYFNVIERFSAYTLIKCRLKTGRTHQIRVHTKYIGHSIVGDKTYGIRNERFSLDGQLLHAGEIKFIHPKSKKELSFTCPLPNDFERVLSVLRKEK